MQNELGLFSWSGLLLTLTVFPTALLTGHAYEMAGVVASTAVHLGVNTTMALLTVDSTATRQPSSWFGSPWQPRSWPSGVAVRRPTCPTCPTV